MRVNARLEGESERQMEFLAQKTGMGISDVIKASIAHYYRSLRQADKPRFSHIREATGRYASGRRDISVKGKALLGESLSRKHARKPG